MIRGPLLHADQHAQLNGVRPVTARLREDPKVRLAPSTVRTYLRCCAVLQRRYPGLRVNEFERHHLDEFFSYATTTVRSSRSIAGVEIREQSWAVDSAGDLLLVRRPTVGSKGWTHSTVNGYVKGFTFVFGWALDQGLLEHDPCARLGRDWLQPPIYHRDAVWLDEDEIDELCDVVVGDDLLEARDRFICRLLVGTGLRVAELAALRWSDVKGRGDKLQLRVFGKGSKYRTVTPLAVTRASVEEWRDLNARLRGESPSPDDPVVWSSRSRPYGRGKVRHHPVWDKPLGTQAIRKVVATAGRRIGQPGLRPHDLRRSHAGFLQEKGLTLSGIQDQLGHTSVATTQRYLKYRPGKFAEELAAAGI